MAFTAFELCMHFASALIWQFLDTRATHALRAVAWIARTSAPDDAPASDVPASPRTFGSTSFLTPGVAVGVWNCLTPATAPRSRPRNGGTTQICAGSQGLGVVPASDSDSASVETSENEAWQLNRPRRAG